MIQTLNINGFKLNINFEPQLSKNGQEIRLSGIAKNCTLPEKWITNTTTKKDELKNHWIYTFRYIGTDNFVSFEFDYYGKFVGIKK